MAKWCIVWTRPDEGDAVSVSRPLPSSRREGESEAGWLERMKAKVVPPGSANVAIVDEAAIPTSRRFRNAWRRHADGKRVVVHLPLARQQVMAEVRRERDRRLAESDGYRLQLVDMDVRGEEAKALVRYRQSLRDLPETAQAEVDAIQTAEGLAAYAPRWPALGV